VIRQGRILLRDVGEDATRVQARRRRAAHESREDIAPAVVRRSARAEVADLAIELEGIARRLAVDRHFELRREHLPTGTVDKSDEHQRGGAVAPIGQGRAVNTAAVESPRAARNSSQVSGISSTPARCMMSLRSQRMFTAELPIPVAT
jgi:hypothetical protein